ncbi:MAG TPA: LacI family DNA-binding transcriptional regulator [Chloroflexota bacterium]|nr:LacI family DNA-binding transcriptional regulator [Chloroflexota bacterium]
MTIHDVARRARVSITTVSHVINQTRRVEASTRARVEAAIAELGYRRNALANALASDLRRGRTRTIGLILFDIASPLMTAIARGAEDVASAAGYGLFLCNTDQRADKQRAYMEMLLEHQVAGILIGPVEGTSADVARLHGSGVPLVTLGYNAADLALDGARLDYAGGARAASAHLVAHGHRRIAVLLAQGDRRLPVAEQRLRGHRQALREAGIAPDPGLEVAHEDSRHGAHAAAARLLDSEVPFTAVFSFTTTSTLGLLVALRERRRLVPDDVSVVSFGDADWLAAHDPPITAVAAPNDQVGARAAGLLLRRIAEAERLAAGGTPESDRQPGQPGSNGTPVGAPPPLAAGARTAPEVALIPTPLIVRRSVAPPRG